MKKEILSAFQKGEVWAFNEIYGRFLKPILRYVRLSISDEGLAQEITQDIFVKVYRYSENYSTGFAFTTWLWTIARNTIKDFKKHRSTQVVHESEISWEAVPTSEPDAQKLLEQKSLRKILFQFSRGLTPLQKRALWMRLVCQHSYQDIARHLGLTVAGVKTLVHRSKRTLQELGLGQAILEWA